MNRKIAYSWIFLLLLGYIATDFISSFFILICLWSGILILGNTVMIKYGWKQDKILCLYWVITLCLGSLLAAFQYYSIDAGNKLIPINHINTIWMFIIGINFIITTIRSKIYFFAPLGIIMIIGALPLDTIHFSFPATIYGILFTIILIGYTVLSFLTPQDKNILGEHYNEANGFNEEVFTKMHKFKCKNCGYTYEGHEKLNYCPRCMAGSDMLIDVD